MGYYTSYSLEMFGEVEEVEKAENDLLVMTEYENGDYDPEIKELVNTGGVYAKLYDIQDYLKEVAKKNPNVLIVLNGDGEESDDLWEERYKGELFEHNYATIPPFKNPELQIPETKNS